MVVPITQLSHELQRSCSIASRNPQRNPERSAPCPTTTLALCHPVSSALPGAAAASRPADRQHVEEDAIPARRQRWRGTASWPLRSYGDAKTEPRKTPATDETLFLFVQPNQGVTSSAVWRWSRRASFLHGSASPTPAEFAQRGKGEIPASSDDHQGAFRAAT